MSFVYDAAVLIAAERDDRRIWNDHWIRTETDRPLVPATVIAQVSRTARQARLRQFLRGCRIIALDEDDAHSAGRLLGATHTSDVVDATVVVIGSRHRATILTADVADIERLVRAAGDRCRVARL